MLTLGCQTRLLLAKGAEDQGAWAPWVSAPGPPDQPPDQHFLGPDKARAPFLAPRLHPGAVESSGTCPLNVLRE